MSESDTVNGGVEEELAELAVDLLLLSQELVNTKIKLQELSKMGWIEMAKARYIMGPNSVSALQIPKANQEKPVSASRTVYTSECLRGDGNVRHSYYSYTDPLIDDSDLPEGVRRRKGTVGGGVEEVQTKPRVVEDPIRWFGFMPPQPLKQSQKCFHTALETVMEITNIQSEIRGVEDRIKFLRRRSSNPELKPGKAGDQPGSAVDQPDIKADLSEDIKVKCLVTEIDPSR